MLEKITNAQTIQYANTAAERYSQLGELIQFSKHGHVVSLQYRLNNELEEHTKADHNYYIHVSTVFDLCRRAKEIFVSSETAEKRALLNFLLQNPTVEGKKFEFSLKSPFDLVLSLASEQSKSRALNPACTTWGG